MPLCSFVFLFFLNDVSLSAAPIKPVFRWNFVLRGYGPLLGHILRAGFFQRILIGVLSPSRTFPGGIICLALPAESWPQEWMEEAAIHMGRGGLERPKYHMTQLQ